MAENQGDFLLEKTRSFLDNYDRRNESEDLTLKVRFKKDKYNCLTVSDSKHSIKCVFEKKNFSSFIQSNSIDDLESKPRNLEYNATLKSISFDILAVKHGADEKIDLRVVLFIRKFAIDKESLPYEGDKIPMNINNIGEIRDKTYVFFLEYVNVKAYNFRKS